jgi:hypothetical protein
LLKASTKATNKARKAHVKPNLDTSFKRLHQEEVKKDDEEKDDPMNQDFSEIDLSSQLTTNHGTPQKKQFVI